MWPQAYFFMTREQLMTLKMACSLKVFEKKELRRIFGPEKDEVQEAGENYIMSSYNL
jgi:hypothetical protein